MKKNGMLNSHIAKVLADLGHTDTIVVGDVGLPIPPGVPKIDLALTLGTPGFIEVVEAIADDMVVEKIVIAEEMKRENKETLHDIQELFRIARSRLARTSSSGTDSKRQGGYPYRRSQALCELHFAGRRSFRLKRRKHHEH